MARDISFQVFFTEGIGDDSKRSEGSIISWVDSLSLNPQGVPFASKQGQTITWNEPITSQKSVYLHVTKFEKEDKSDWTDAELNVLRDLAAKIYPPFSAEDTTRLLNFYSQSEIDEAEANGTDLLVGRNKYVPVVTGPPGGTMSQADYNNLVANRELTISSNEFFQIVENILAQRSATEQEIMADAVVV